MSSYPMMTILIPINGTIATEVSTESERRKNMRLTSHQRPYRTNEIYHPRLYPDVLLPIITLCVRLIITSGRSCLNRGRSPPNYKSSCLITLVQRCGRKHLLLAKNLSSLRIAIAFMRRTVTYSMVPNPSMLASFQKYF